MKVVSLAEQYPGPYATMLLADLGADVVLVERPDGGDPSRRFEAFHESLNRNKRSVALNLKDGGGRAAFLELARSADAVLEGFSPGVVERLGIAHADVEAVNPGVVYVSVSGFGRTGPLCNRAAHDISYQALAGMLAGAGAEQPPPEVAIGDLSAGLFATIAVLTGLVSRGSTGVGGYYDVAMLDSLMSLMTIQMFARANGFGSAGIPPREPAYGVFETADGRRMSLSVSYEDWFWRDLCGVLGLDEVASLTSADRQERYGELRDRIAAAISARCLDELEQDFGSVRVPFGAVRNIDEIVADAAHNGLLLEVAATSSRPARRHVRQPIRISGDRSDIGRHVPAVGEHTVEVLAEAGVPTELIEDLLARAVAVQRRAAP